MSTYLEKYRTEIEKIGIKRAADLLGVSRNTIYNWMSKGNMPLNNVFMLCHEGFDLGLVLGDSVILKRDIAEDGLSNKNSPNHNLVSITGTGGNDEFIDVPIGQENKDEKYQKYLTFRHQWLIENNLKENDLAMYFCTHSAMEPTMSKGDTLLTDQTNKKLSEGEIYLFLIGEEACAKRIQNQIDGSIKLINDNKTYDAQTIKEENIKDLIVIGKIVWIGKILN